MELTSWNCGTPSSEIAGPVFLKEKIEERRNSPSNACLQPWHLIIIVEFKVGYSIVVTTVSLFPCLKLLRKKERSFLVRKFNGLGGYTKRG